jgi:hypothetical protein
MVLAAADVAERLAGRAGFISGSATRANSNRGAGAAAGPAPLHLKSAPAPLRTASFHHAAKGGDDTA